MIRMCDLRWVEGQQGTPSTKSSEVKQPVVIVDAYELVLKCDILQVATQVLLNTS